MYAKSIRLSAKLEVQKEWSAKRDDWIARPRCVQTCERSARWECANEAGRFFFLIQLNLIINLNMYWWILSWSSQISCAQLQYCLSYNYICLKCVWDIRVINLIYNHNRPYRSNSDCDWFSGNNMLLNHQLLIEPSYTYISTLDVNDRTVLIVQTNGGTAFSVTSTTTLYMVAWQKVTNASFHKMDFFGYKVYKLKYVN